MGSEAKGPGSSRSFGGQPFGGGTDRSTEAEERRTVGAV